MSLAIATAAGSAGQVFGAPLAEWLLASMAWQQVFLVFAAAILAVLLRAAADARARRARDAAELEETLGAILGRALRDPSFALIFLGFFSCGYQLGFITAHFPAFVTEICGAIAPGGMLAALGITSTSALGAVSISVIGLANIGGHADRRLAGRRWPRSTCSPAIYAARTIVAAACSS